VGGHAEKLSSKGGQTTKSFRNTALHQTVNTPKMTVTYKSSLHRNISCQQQQLALYYSGNQIRIRWVEQVACMGDRTGAHRILVLEPDGRR